MYSLCFMKSERPTAVLPPEKARIMPKTNNIEHKYSNTTFENNNIAHKYSNTTFEY